MIKWTIKNIKCRRRKLLTPAAVLYPAGGCSKTKMIDPFLKTAIAILPTYSSIPSGWILRLERRGCRFESCLLYRMTCSYNGEYTGLSPRGCGFDSHTGCMVCWCNGNITDCRSVATGSIPVQTAANCWIVQRQHIRFWLWRCWFESSSNNKCWL